MLSYYQGVSNRAFYIRLFKCDISFFVQNMTLCTYTATHDCPFMYIHTLLLTVLFITQLQALLYMMVYGNSLAYLTMPMLQLSSHVMFSSQSLKKESNGKEFLANLQISYGDCNCGCNYMRLCIVWHILWVCMTAPGSDFLLNLQVAVSFCSNLSAITIKK